MNIEQFEGAAETASVESLSSTAGLGNLNLEDMKSLNGSSEANGVFGELTIEDTSSGDIQLASGTTRRNGSGRQDSERDARLDRLLS